MFLKISFHIGQIRIRNDNSGSGSGQNILDPTGSGSGSGSATLALSQKLMLKAGGSRQIVQTSDSHAVRLYTGEFFNLKMLKNCKDNFIIIYKDCVVCSHYIHYLISKIAMQKKIIFFNYILGLYKSWRYSHQDEQNK